MHDSITLKNKLGIDHRYTVISELPTGLRYSGKTISNIYVRDLMFDEIKALSLYLSKEYDLNQLVSIYSDIIKVTTLDGEQFDLMDLELVDFHYMVIVSSILTDSEAAWNITRDCTSCGESISAKFFYSDIDYEFDKDLKFPIPLLGTEKTIHPLLVKDYIALLDDNVTKFLIQNEIKIDDNIAKELLSYAVSLNYNSVKELVDNVNLLNSSPKLINIVKDINQSSLVTIKPFTECCPKCSQTNHFKYDFSVLRGYL